MRGRSYLLPNIILFLVALAGCGGEAASSDQMAINAETIAPAHDTTAERESLGGGFVVWESIRTGDWRLWWRRLDASDPVQLSPDGPGQHCCPQISPDGTRVAFLNRRIHRTRKPAREVVGTLEVIAIDGSGQRTVAPKARTAGRGHRAIVWHSDHELVYIDGDGTTQLLDVDSGESRALLSSPEENLGWLVDPTMSSATTGFPTFSPYDESRGQVARRHRFGGCEPYFSGDGRWGYWVAGAGGPVHRIDLDNREISVVLRKNDARLGDQGYVYFPIRSRDGRLFAFAASAGEHDHSTSNYDVYVAHTDPESFEILGRPVRLTMDPASDRYPDVFAEPLAPDADPREQFAVLEGDSRGSSDIPESAVSAWPPNRRALLFAWQTNDQANLVYDPALGAETTYPLTAKGRARFDRHQAMVLGDGTFEAPPEAAERIFAAAKASNELTIEAVVRTAHLDQEGPARILTFSSRPGRRNFTLGQEGQQLVVRIRTGLTGPNADRPQVQLTELRPDVPMHVVVTYSPGMLRTWVDGEQVTDSFEIQEGFFAWQPGTLIFGDEINGGFPWKGLLEGVAIYDRALDVEEIQESYTEYRRILDGREPLSRLATQGILRAKSEFPTRDQIAPYRQALVIYEYEVDGVASNVRVAHWAILDDEVLPVSRLSIGDSVALSLEPFETNPQLESHYLADTLPTTSDLRLYYQVELLDHRP